MNSTPEHIPQRLVAADSAFPSARRALPRLSKSWLMASLPLLLAGSLLAQDRKPAEGLPRGERTPGVGGPRAEFPEELKLTEDQQAKIKAIDNELALNGAELSKKRESYLTDEQKAANVEVMKKIRAGGLTRQEVGEQLSAALKLTPEQKSQIEEVDLARRKMTLEAKAQKEAVLTEDQRSTMHKLGVARAVARTFSIPGGIEATEAQKASLKALQDELGARLIELNEKQSSVLTNERLFARDAAYKEARDSGKDRQATAAALDSAMKMTDAEKKQLAEAEQGLRELDEQIRARITALLTPEQKAEVEKKGGARR